MHTSVAKERRSIMPRIGSLLKLPELLERKQTVLQMHQPYLGLHMIDVRWCSLRMKIA